jgi:hypothetical protein
MPRRRKNARFTGAAQRGAGSGTRALVTAFYAEINREIPGDTPVTIPAPASVRPKHDAITQAYVFADYAVRKIAPVAFEEAGLPEYATKLRKLRKIDDGKTAEKARILAEQCADLARFAAHVFYVNNAGATARFAAAAVSAAEASNVASSAAAFAAANALVADAYYYGAADYADYDATADAYAFGGTADSHVATADAEAVAAANCTANAAARAARLDLVATWAAVTEMLTEL